MDLMPDFDSSFDEGQMSEIDEPSLSSGDWERMDMKWLAKISDG